MMRLTRKHWAVATTGWAVVLMFVSVIPGRDLPSLNLWQADKLFHALFYGLLTFLLFRLIMAGSSTPARLKTILISALLCILYGFFIEWIQLLLPSRSFDLLDGLANSIGCGITLLLVMAIRPKRARA